MISPYRIKFRNKANTDFDLIVGAALDSDNGNTESFLTKESTSSVLYDGSRKNVHGYHYTDVVNASFTLIKRDYTDITDDERRAIYAWLTGSNKPEELAIYKDDSEVVSYRLIGSFTTIEHYKLTNGRDAGVVVNFEHISPYAYSPVKTFTKSITTPETFIINCKSDAHEQKLFPRITVALGPSEIIEVLDEPTSPTCKYNMIPNTVYKYIQDTSNALQDLYYIKVNGVTHPVSVTTQSIEAIPVNEGLYCMSTWDNSVYRGVRSGNVSVWEKIPTGASFEIQNTHNGDVISRAVVTDCFKNEIITLDGDNKIISSSRTPMRIIGDSFNWEWIYLLPGENEISVQGGVDITIEWVEPIKIGNM